MVGFAMTQIAHLAMIPVLSSSDDERTSLTVIRNSMNAMANILAYVIALISFSYGTNQSKCKLV